ncbi:MAG TPA: thioredoxin family protein [Terracidiphilus sp.]
MFSAPALLTAQTANTAGQPVSAQHLSVQLVSKENGVKFLDTIHAGLYFKLDPGWHVYWSNPGDSGEPPRIDWNLPKTITPGPMQFPAPKRLPLGPLMDYGYENEVLFPIDISYEPSIKPGTTLKLAAKVSWLVCREVCIPGKANVELDVPVLASEPPPNADMLNLFNRLDGNMPQGIPHAFWTGFQQTPTGFRLEFDTGQPESQAEFFPEDQDILNNAAPENVKVVPKGVILDLVKDPTLNSNQAQLRGVLELSGGRNYDIAALPAIVNEPASGAVPTGSTSIPLAPLARIAGLAFLGGMLLNLMPCVFPVLFLKGLALCRSGAEERHKLRAHGFVYTAGILVSFWVLVALLLALRSAGATLGWGFQFQSPIFLSLMAGLLFFLGLSLAGQFEIGLTLTSAGGSLAAKQGCAGSFFTGVLAVVVATPCTAPFMGAAIGYALAQPAAVTFAVFTALALGLAAPYVALTLQPAWTRVLPKPGAWMDVLKQAVSVPIFATVIWLALVVASAYGAVLLAVLLASFLLLAIAGWFLGRWPAKRWATVVASLILAIVVAACFVAPREFAAMPVSSSAPPSSEGPSPRSGWQPWSADAVQKALAAGRPVFVDFTASWCLSCQVNERVALDRPETMQAFQSANVALFKADWTREDPAITEELTKLGRSGVPVYALYGPGQTTPTLLPQVLTPGIVTGALANVRK